MIKIVFQHRGESLCLQGGSAVRIGPGEGVLLDMSRPFRVVSEGAADQSVAVVPPDMARRCGLAAEQGAPLRFSLSDIRAAAPAGLLRLIGVPDPTREGAAALSSAEQVRRQVKAYIDANLRDPELAIDQIAAALRLSKRYLHMCFAAEGASIADYLWQARLDQSRRELERDAGSGRTVTDIAFACGFNSSSHFSRLFKRRFGRPPSRLRN
jgi:AraC-like DNA-binding protein